MDREEFRTIRDHRPKRIEGDIALLQRAPDSLTHEASGIRVTNGLGVDLRLTLRWNHETGKKTIAIHVPGVGPICRLDADGPRHGAAGRTHKHSLWVRTCPKNNLPIGVIARPELSGLDVTPLFLQFCLDAGITFTGRILIGH